MIGLARTADKARRPSDHSPSKEHGTPHPASADDQSHPVHPRGVAKATHWRGLLREENRKASQTDGPSASRLAERVARLCRIRLELGPDLESGQPEVIEGEGALNPETLHDGEREAVREAHLLIRVDLEESEGNPFEFGSWPLDSQETRGKEGPCPTSSLLNSATRCAQTRIS